MYIIVFIIAVLCAQVSSHYGCFLNYTESTLTISIPEKISYGEKLFTTLTTNNIYIERGELPHQLIPFFVELYTASLGEELYDISLVSNTNVTEIDDNKTLCEMSRGWGFKLICRNAESSALLIDFVVNYTDDADPVLNISPSFRIPELSPVNTTVANLRNIADFYTDKDCAANTQVIYYFQGGNTDEAFRLSNGVISVNRLISYQKGEIEFKLTVLVTTNHGFNFDSDFDSGRTGSTQVVINITDIDDNDPVFDNPVYTVHVQEENSTVLNVPQLTSPPVFAFDQDTGINDIVTYSTNSISDTVGIVNDTGLVWVTRVLDREAEPFVNLTIKANQVHNSWRSAVATLMVVVDDINDNRPKFEPDNPNLVRIPEHCAAGLSVVRVLAVDADTGENALFNYTLDPRQSSFTIQTDNVEKPRYGVVTVTNSSALDRETISSLNITLGTVEYTPTQGGDCSAGMCNITITIELTDINDNSPVFEKLSYSVTVTDITIGSFVEMVNATDADEGENADLVYKCVSYSLLWADACGVVSINNKTGELRLSHHLNSLQMYFALIEACDSPSDLSQRRCTTVPVTVALDLEVNVTSYNFTVHENLPAGAYVGDILIYNRLFMLQHDKFELEERTLRTTKPLDREKDDQFLLIINTNNQNNTNISVLVTVLDVNDNSPVFDNSSYVLIVMDNSVDAFLETVNASDADEGENADLQYKCVSYLSPVSDGCSVVTVSNTTGDVKLQRSLDSSQMYFALVEACDSPADISQNRCTTVPVVISLHPDLELNVTSYNFSVYENLPAGTQVGDILSYNDPYTFQDDNFELNERTLRTTIPLDREDRDKYTLVINTNNKNNTNISVLVTVLDVNDNSPVFNNTNYRLTVVNNSRDAFVETINAGDADEGENAVLRYRCVSSVTTNDACGVMTVNDTTGETRLRQALNSSHTYYALVEACDSLTNNSQRRCTTVPVGIHLPSSFNATSYNFTVHENLPAGTYVGDVLNREDHFVLQHDKFELNEGTLRTKEPLDREEEDRHMLVINTNNQNNTNISILVIVLDVNDNNPVFSPHNGSVTMSGKETTGQVITVVNASDDDEGVNAEMTYSLQPDSLLQYFYINDSGAVILQTLSTLETMDLLIKASDGGSPSLSGFYTLRITIPAVNGSVVIFAPVTSDIVAGKKKSVEGELMLILGVNVTIETIRQHSADSSAIYITARGMSTGQPLKVEELQKLVDSKPAEIADLFRQTVPDGTYEKATAADDFNTPVIVLIVIAAILLIGLIIATVLIARVYKRKRNKRLFKRLSSTSTVFNSAIEDGNKQEEVNEAINPDFAQEQEEEEDSQNVTLINETEVTSAADNDDDVSENETTERPPDADSGVPSDRENGQGDDDDIDNSSDDGSSSPQSPHSSGNLAAVLDEPLLNSADPGHDAVDVTSPGMYSDELEALLLPVDSLESGPPAEPPVDFDVQDSYPIFAEEEFPKEITEQEPPVLQAEFESDLDPVTPDDEVEDIGSLNGFLGFRLPTRSFTPPMIRKSQEQREEELEPMPEEPMPDYGKRVRFNFQVTEHEITDYNDNDGELENDGNDVDDPADDEEEFPTPTPPLPPPPTSSTDDNEFSDDLRRSDEHDPNTNEEEEITSF